MRKPILTLIAFFLFIYNLGATKVAGYYISTSLDTIRVIFDITTKARGKLVDFEEMQRGLDFFDSLKNRQFLEPSQAREISFDYLGQRNRMLAGTFTKSRPNSYFFHLVKDGKLKLYKYYYKGAVNYMMQKEGGDLFQSRVRYLYSDEKRYNSYGPPDKNGMPTYYYNVPGPAVPSMGGYDVTVKKTDDPFAEDVSIYLLDCPVLSNKIRNLTYVRKDTEKIVDEYNSTCK